MRTPKDIDSAVNNGGTTTAVLGTPGIGFSGVTKTGGIPAIAPQSFASSGTAVNGTGIDRLVVNGPFTSCSVFATSGTSTGSPGTQAGVFTLQDSADNVTFANYLPPGYTSAPTLTLSADNSAGQMGIDLSGARQYVRVTATGTYTTITAQLYAAMIVFGGAVTEPTL